MRLEPGSQVKFLYTDAQGEQGIWMGEVRRVKESYFSLETDEGYRNFRFDRVEGDIEDRS